MGNAFEPLPLPFSVVSKIDKFPQISQLSEHYMPSDGIHCFIDMDVYYVYKMVSM